MHTPYPLYHLSIERRSNFFDRRFVTLNISVWGDNASGRAAFNSNQD